MEEEGASDDFLSPTISHINDENNYDEKAELEALERVVGDTRAKAIRLSPSLLKHITNDFSYENRIGAGTFAEVYLGVLPNGSRMAIKRLRDNINAYEDGAYINEVSTMKRFADHKHIVRLIGYCNHIQEELAEYKGKTVTAQRFLRFICMEYVPNGTLHKYILDEFPGGLDWNQRYHILKGIFQGLRHLHHEVRIVHGDIKPDNILLDENLVPKIFDFGLSRHFASEGESSIVTENVIGTRGYLAPEFIESNLWSIKSDIFSIGVTILQLLVGHDLYRWWGEQSVEQVLKQLRKRLVKEGAFSLWVNKYQQVRTCLEICNNCMDIDPDRRPTAFEIIQLLEETESTDYSGDSGNAPPLWQSGDEESDLSDADTTGQMPEPESTVEFPPSEEELTDLVDTNGETSNQGHDKLDAVSKLLSDELSKLNVLERITDDFSHKRIVGKDGTFRGSHKAFVYKGEIPRQKMIAVKRLIGVEIPAEKFKREAEQFMSLDHKNIAKVAGYCHDESRGQKLVQFKGKPLPHIFNGPEQVLCYEYVHNGSLREYLTGQGSREIDWHMRYRLIKGTCEGLHYLHKGRKDCPIIHLNLNPSSVLLDENNVPRITGFDFSKLIGENRTKSVVLKMNGPVAYLPPDFFHFKGTNLTYLATVDIYSLGLMILEITTRLEIKAGDHGKLIKSIEENWREESQIASLYTSLEADKLWQVKMCIDIGLDCVKSKPEKRPTARDIMLWLDKGSKPVPAPRLGAGGVPRPPVRTNITQADDHIQEKAKSRTGFLKLFGRK